ncbi:unnamed protein product [Caenorhabditis sp. 36 PRJEB53466]|nr:unnamed protein product [Caenorhabditis sp. 36 PRJEB53466]
MATCSVDFDKTPAVYSPGEKLAGSVKMIVADEDFKARKVRMEMIGKAYTYWEGNVKNNTKIKNGDIARVRHNCADHKGKIVYCRFESIVWKSDGTKHEMPAGEHTFPFSFQLPHWAPPSFEGDLGFIRYFIKVEIDRPWKFDDKFITCFTVLPKIDLSLIPNSQLPSRKHVCEQIGAVLWKRGAVRVEIRIPKQGFVCGEHIPVEMKIDNRTSKKFKQISLRLVQRVTYTGFRDGFVNSQSHACIGHEKEKITYATRLNAQVRVEERKISEDIVDIQIDKNEKVEMDKALSVPPLAPSTKTCEIIDVEYYLKVKMSTLGTFPSAIKLELPFIIGNVPIESDLKFDYKKSVFGYSATVLKNRDVQKFAPLYPKTVHNGIPTDNSHNSADSSGQLLPVALDILETSWNARSLGAANSRKIRHTARRQYPAGPDSEQLGPGIRKVYGFTEGMQKVLVLSDPRLVQELFVKQYDNFYGRKLNPIQGDPDKDADVHIVGAQGFRWKRLRTITAPAFSNNSIRKVLGRIEDSSLEFLKHLEREATREEGVNIYFQEFTMDVIMRIAMGQPDSQMFNNPLLYDCKGFFENNRWQMWMLGGAFPFAVTVLKTMFLKLGLFGAGPFVKVHKTVREAVMARIAQRETDEKEGIEHGEPEDFIDLFLNAKADDVAHFGEDNEEFTKATVYNNSLLTVQEIISQCVVFLVAGFDTTAISLAFVAYFAALHPEVQRKMQEEVDRECPDPEITFDQLAKLKYVENAIKEALRIFPLASFANSRRCMRTTKLGETTVEAGVDVMLDTWTLHHDPSIWGPDVEEFRPERWETSSAHTFLSFGAGPRQCLGMRLAYLEQKILLAHVLRKHSFVANNKTSVPMKLVGRSTTRPADLWLSVKPRF